MEKCLDISVNLEKMLGDNILENPGQQGFEDKYVEWDTTKSVFTK